MQQVSTVTALFRAIPTRNAEERRIREGCGVLRGRIRSPS